MDSPLNRGLRWNGGRDKDKIYSDIKSGMTLDRPGFIQLLSDVMDYKVKAVYVSYKDRLARLSYELVEKLWVMGLRSLSLINTFFIYS
ncbi:recombinase family protein [Helicobacter suis]|uniref:recombinase family protein n=1 Tax=Helicobacter suis TaxID=104628 RepID=UPI001F076BB1|nr:recombinase family protein [Helicobacter suis]